MQNTKVLRKAMMEKLNQRFKLLALLPIACIHHIYDENV